MGMDKHSSLGSFEEMAEAQEAVETTETTEAGEATEAKTEEVAADNVEETITE